MRLCSNHHIDVKVNQPACEVEHMRIGELSERTGVSRRLLRYYEEQELIVPGRSPNGYRDYDERLVDQVVQIRGLLDGGLPTRLIKQILPCLKTPREIHFADASPGIIATLERERDRMTDRIEFLTRNRDAIAEYLNELRKCASPEVRAASSREQTQKRVSRRRVGVFCVCSRGVVTRS